MSSERTEKQKRVSRTCLVSSESTEKQKRVKAEQNATEKLN